jgi:immune inhibitor A
MKNKNEFYRIYEQGPTACMPRPKVLQNIQKEIKNSGALSRGDIRLATAMGLISANTLRPLGFNDGMFYPLSEVTPAPVMKMSPSSLISVSSTKKSLHALAIMVDFSDNVGARPASDFQHLLFDATNPDSMTSYYDELSKGQIKITGEVIGYVRAPQPYSYYTDGQSGTGDNYPRNTPGLLVDALTEFCKNDTLKRFDTDGDGYVDGIFLIHAGGGAEAEPDETKRPHMIWSHKWVLPVPFVNQGVKVFAYSTEPEDGRVGVFAHEFGHVLGLPDLYDTTYRTRGVGDWCLMGGGSWGGDGDKPTRMSCWCLANLGWIQPQTVKTTGTLQIDTLANNSKACYRLWTQGKKGPEYFLIENRQQTGQDTALPGTGLAIWHIDETQTENTNPLSYKVGLVQADGKRDLENNRNGGEAGDLFPGSTKVTSISDSSNPSTRANDGSPTGVKITQIKETSGKIKARIKV